MEFAINTCAVSLGGIGLGVGHLGAGVDIGAIATAWTALMTTLAIQAGHSLDNDTIKKLALAVATGVAMFMGGMKAATTIIGWVGAVFTGGASLVISALVNGTLNSTITYSFGRAVARYFLETDKIDDIEVASSIILGAMGEDLGFGNKD